MVGEEKLSDKTMHSLEKRILVDELHAPARRNFKRRRVVVKGYDDLWQADIVAPPMVCHLVVVEGLQPSVRQFAPDGLV